MSETKDINLSFDEVIKLVRTLVTEMRAPSPQEVEKNRLEAEAKEKQRAAMIEAAKAETATREAEQRHCAHVKPDGTRNLGGQVHSDGKVRLICKWCQKELVNRVATADDFQHGPLELLIENAPRIARVV